MFRFNVVASRVFCISKEKLVAGSNRNYRCSFTFGPEWDGFTKYIQFRNNDKYCAVTLDDCLMCSIPLEILMFPGYLYLGIVGVRVSTNTVYPVLEILVGEITVNKEEVKNDG